MRFCKLLRGTDQGAQYGRTSPNCTNCTLKSLDYITLRRSPLGKLASCLEPSKIASRIAPCTAVDHVALLPEVGVQITEQDFFLPTISFGCHLTPHLFDIFSPHPQWRCLVMVAMGAGFSPAFLDFAHHSGPPSHHEDAEGKPWTCECSVSLVDGSAISPTRRTTAVHYPGTYGTLILMSMDGDSQIIPGINYLRAAGLPLLLHDGREKGCASQC